MNKKIMLVLLVILIIAIGILAGIYIKNKNEGSEEETNISQNNTVENNESENEIIEEPEESKKDIKQDEPEEDKNPHTGNKVLIAYFSRAGENYNVGVVEKGNTEIIAEYIKSYFGGNADTYKIEPVKPYPSTYEECKKVANKEKSDNARPEIKGKLSNFGQYEIVFIGYPIWCEDVPMIINTFLESYDFKNKTIIPFNTHEGSGESGTYKYLKDKMTLSVVNTKGFSIKGSEGREDGAKQKVLNWLDEIGF